MLKTALKISVEDAEDNDIEKHTNDLTIVNETVDGKKENRCVGSNEEIKNVSNARKEATIVSFKTAENDAGTPTKEDRWQEATARMSRKMRDSGQDKSSYDIIRSLGKFMRYSL